MREYKEIYLDNAATTKPADTIRKKAAEISEHIYGNPSSFHVIGMKSQKLMDDCRQTIGNYISCEPDNIIFTSGGTEANNIAVTGPFLKSLLNQHNNKKRKLLISTIEHASVFQTANFLKKFDVEVKEIPVDSQGNLNLSFLEKNIDKHTKLAAIIGVNNEIGTIQDLQTISRIIKEKNPETLLHVDGVQMLGKIPVNIKNLNIDSFSISAHKIHGLKGIGALYLNNPDKYSSCLQGGGQEKGLRPGTENITGISSLQSAIELCRSVDNNAIKELNHFLLQGLKQINNVKIISPSNASPYIINFSCVGKKGEIILHFLEEKGIYLSAMSACSNKKNKNVSRIIQSLGYNNKISQGCLRIGLSCFNKKNEINHFLSELKIILKKLYHVVS